MLPNIAFSERGCNKLLSETMRNDWKGLSEITTKQYSNATKWENCFPRDPELFC